VLSRCLVEPRNSLARVSDWWCGSAGRNAVVGVDSRAAGAIQHKARQGRAVVTQTQTGDAVHKQAGGGENHESSLTGACSGDGRRRLREREEEQSAAQKRASEQAGRQIDSETQQARVQRGEGRRAFKDSRRFADTHTLRPCWLALLLLCSGCCRDCRWAQGCRGGPVGVGEREKG
jgi:hypothetical protein